MAVLVGPRGHRRRVGDLLRAAGSRFPRVPPCGGSLEDKFYFDWLYDRIFYAPAVLRSPTRLRREFEEPVVLQTGTDIGETTLATGSLVRRLQTGLLRTYVLFVAAGAAAVVLAFLIAK